MKGWTLETAYQDDIFGVMPVALIPPFLASLRKHPEDYRSTTSPKIWYTFLSSFYA